MKITHWVHFCMLVLIFKCHLPPPKGTLIGSVFEGMLGSIPSSSTFMLHRRSVMQQPFLFWQSKGCGLCLCR